MTVDEEDFDFRDGLNVGLSVALIYLSTDEADFEGFNPELVSKFKEFAGVIAETLSRAREKVLELEALKKEFN